jgi:glycosyltransferase involved in cell wall biosynthesis
MNGDVWALSAYPLSAGYRRRLETAIGGPVAVTLVPEMRSRGMRSMLRTLRRVNAAQGLAIVEDPSSRPIVPVLRFLLSLTRCRRLAVVDEHGAERPVTRGAGLGESVALLLGSIAGAFAALRCWFELRSLARAAPLRPALRPLSEVAYLKTNLWFGVKAGGSVGHVAGIVNELAERCHVSVFAVERPPLLDPRVTLHTVAQGGAFGYPHELNYYRYQGLFNRAALAEGLPAPDLIYQRLSLANYSGVVVARRLRRPLVLEYNGSEVWVSRHWGRPLSFPRLGALAEEVVLRHADLIVTVSDVLRDELLEKGLPSERVLSHPNCIDPKRFDPDHYTNADRRELLGRYDIPEAAVVCGFVGTFGAWHGVTVLAEAIKRLCSSELEWVRAHDVRFLIVGDGLLMPKVRDILTGVPANRVVLTGLVPQDEAPRYLAASDILLSPHVPNADGSRFFGSPTKLFEYMAMSRGIVASDLDQIGDVLRHSYRAADLPSIPCPAGDDHLAVLTTPGSVDELISGIRFLVEREDYRASLGRAARAEVLARYTWKRNVDELLARLGELNRGVASGESDG